MAIPCTINKRQNNINPDAQTVYHIKPLVRHTVDMDELARRISSTCTLTQADVVACLNALNHQLILALLNGDKVDMAWMGTFKIAMQTSAQPNPGLCSKNDIKKIGINYQANGKLKHELQARAKIELPKEAQQRYEGQ